MSEPASPEDSRSWQPWLHDLVVALAAPTQWWCGPDGEVTPGGVQGLWHGDVRGLSRVRLLVGDIPPVPVLVHPQGAGTVRVVAVARNLGDGGPDPTVRVERTRSVVPGGGREVVTLTSSASTPVRTDVRLELACDLAAMDDVKAGLATATVAPGAIPSRGAARWDDGVAGVEVHAPGARLRPGSDGVEASWDVDLAPGEEVSVEWSVVLTDARAVVAGPPDAERAPWTVEVTADDRRLAPWVEQALADLAALRLVTTEQPDAPFVAAGAPWFLTLFGRDSLWAARMLLPVGTDLAASTLRVLARRQGRVLDPVSAEEPGKILHELRRDSFDQASAAGTLHLPPVYFGTVDATSLWVSLLHDAWRWGLADEQVEALLPHLQAALGWMTAYGDSDGDGFLEYVDTAGTGLSNQGWKDSGDSVQWHGGGLADAPIALCEVQGYAYEAAVCGAALLEAFDLPGGDRWRSWASDLADRFRKHFWVTDADGAYPAIALDAAKRPVDSLTSNAGHLLGTGLLDRAEEEQVALRLSAGDMNSGYGLRTLSSTAAGYSPLSYHGGSVWTHDTAIVLAGLARGGHGAAAAGLVEGLLATAGAFGGRLPELHSGHARGDVPAPVPYPAACRPQAWSAAAAVATLSAVIGLRPDVPGGTVDVVPLAPSPVGAVRVRGLRVAGREVEVAVDTEGRVLSGPPPRGLR